MLPEQVVLKPVYTEGGCTNTALVLHVETREPPHTHTDFYFCRGTACSRPRHSVHSHLKKNSKISEGSQRPKLPLGIFGFF